MTRRPVRIANFSGYAGDRLSALDEVMGGDPVDVLMGDYLAEYTLAALSARARRDPSRGFVDTFLVQLRPHLAAVAERGLKVVTNAGGFAPSALADAVRAAAAEAGVDLRVAAVEGDGLLDALPSLQAAGHRFEHLDTGAPLSAWGAEPIAANAYLGGWGIAAALAEGADVVVCGRVTDASLTLGPAAWWHGWARDDWHALAGALAAGHVVECGPHATGGNFSGSAGIPGMARPGFPVAEVAADGTAVITKHAGQGGAVTVDTVTAQLVYEVQGPVYLNPDVTLHLDTVRLEQEGPDRVRMSGATGSPPPPTTKVAVFAPVGFQVVQTVFVTAPDVEQKVALLRAQLAPLLEEGVDHLEVQPLGVAADDPQTQWEATVPVRIMATARTRDAVARDRVADRIGAMFLSSYAGFYTDTGATPSVEPRPRVDYWPAVLPVSVVPHRVLLDDGRVLDVEPSPAGALLPQPVHPEPEEVPDLGPVRRVPLGLVAHARAGDKGGNSNVGVWVSDARAWPWLRAALSTAELRRLVPELKDLEVVRHELPHLRAVHLVLKGLLGTGGSSNLRVDPVGKAVGEYLRAKHVLVPESLLP